MALALRVTNGYSHLASLSGEWDDLLLRSGQDQPTLAPDWVLNWCRVFGAAGGRRIRTGEVRCESRLVALMPLIARRRLHRNLLPLRSLELVCTGEPEADEILSEYVGVIVERGLESSIADLLARGLSAGRFGPADELRIPAMNSEDPMAVALSTALRQEGWLADLSGWSEAPYAPLAQSWDAFLNSLPGRRRHTVRRAERDLEAWAEGELCLRVATDVASLEEGRRVLERLHGERWQAGGRSGAFASAAFARFHAAVMPALLARGALELIWLEARGAAVAVLYNLVWQNKVYNYQSGRRMDIPKALQPGLAAHARAIRRAIELGRREYDFLGGNRRYKRELSSAVRSLVNLEAHRPGPRQSARRLIDRAAAAVRTSRDRILRLRPAPPAVGTNRRAE